MSLSNLLASAPDLLRLVALPVFGWAAWTDVQTRRIPGDVWIPLAVLGAALLAWDGWVAWNAGGYAWTWEFLLPAGISMGFVVPIAYLFSKAGGFGGADAKALMVLALLFPVTPTYGLGPWSFPLEPNPLGSFSFSILTNAVLVGAAFPLIIAVANAVAGRFTAAMVVGWPVSWGAIQGTNGKMLPRRPSGTPRITFGGLDLDALRMYLRWRGLSLEALREDPDRYREPASLPAEPGPPTDGRVDAEYDASLDADRGSADRETASVAGDAAAATGAATALEVSGDDPWGAAAFLESIEGSAYGTSPETLREGLDALAREETVWITPGTPFLVPVFVGLVLAVGYGDLLVGAFF